MIDCIKEKSPRNQTPKGSDYRDINLMTSQNETQANPGMLEMTSVVFDLTGVPKKDIGELYISDTTWRVFRAHIEWRENTFVVQNERAERFFLFVQIRNEDIGDLYLPVWGQGKGYLAGEYFLARELLTSQFSRCTNWAKQCRCPQWEAVKGSIVSAIAKSDHVACFGLLPDAVIASEELLYEIARKNAKAKGSRPHLSTTLFAERTGENSIGIGPDWPVDRRPEFLRSELHIKLAVEIISATTLPNFWRWIEYERGRYNWEELDYLVKIAHENNVPVLKSFALYWGGMGGTPPWFRKLAFEEQLNAIETWVTAIVARYKSVVRCWETVNEMHNWRGGNPFSWTHEQILHVTRFVNGLVGSIDPGKKRLINCCCVWGEYVQTGRKSLQWGEVPWVATWTPLDYFDQVISHGIEFEAIGLQFYNPARDLATCYQLIEEYAKFGKELQITEMATPSASTTSGLVETGQVSFGGGWRGNWTAETQALWIDRFFHILSMNDQMKVLNYWDFDDAGAFVSDSGLIDLDGNPKLSYDVLREISKEWEKKRGSSRGSRTKGCSFPD